MTEQEIDALPAGLEMDASVARLVLGQAYIQLQEARCPYCSGEMRYCGKRSWCGTCHEWRYSAYKAYSEEIEAAFDVEFSMQKRGYWMMLRSPWKNQAGEWWAGFTPHLTTGWNGRPDYEARAESASLAICRAALKAVSELKYLHLQE